MSYAGQLRRQSILEVVLNTTTGFIISFGATFIVMPLVGLHSSVAQNFWYTMAYTVISLVRSYFWRRFFNWLQWRVI